MATGFASDDYGWLSKGAHGQLVFANWVKVAGHTNTLPLEAALYQLKFTMFGFNALGYHLFALAGHVVNVFLVYLLARRLGSSVRVASLAAGIAAVLAAGAQAIYWMSGDPHLFASLLSLAALILYIDHRERGGWWRYAGAVALALAAPLVKAEGVSVVAGVIGYELIYRRPRAFTWMPIPFFLTPLPFVWWEWTTSDQLSSHRGFGANVVSSAFGYVRQLLLPLDPQPYLQSPGGILHRALNGGIGLALLVEAAVLALFLGVGLARRSSWALVLFGVAGTAPALVVTLGTQSRYTYFAGLVASPIMAAGANGVFKAAWSRYSHQALIPVATLVLAVLISFQTWITAIESGSLRAAHSESLAFRTAVLRDHSNVPEGTPICLVNSPLDVGSAIAVFADPRVGSGVGLPAVAKCATAADAAPGEWVYTREPDGTYLQTG